MDSFKFSDDGKTVNIDLPNADADLTVEHVENLIAVLGAIRGQMAPLVPLATPEPASGVYRPLQNLFVLPAPQNGESAPTLTGALLVARSESFGWFDYPMTPEFCRGLLNWLAARPELINAPPGTTLN